MAKIISYKFAYTDGEPNVEQTIQDKEIICDTKTQYDANHPIAEREAIPGTIEVTGEFDPEPAPEESTDDILNALLGVTV